MKNEIHQIVINQEELIILISALKYIEHEYGFESNSSEEQLLEKLILINVDE